MSQSEYIGILIAIITVLFGILGGFVKKWTSDLEAKIKDLETQMYRADQNMLKQINKHHIEATGQFHHVETNVKVMETSFVYIQKKLDSIEKDTGLIQPIDKKVGQLETNITNFGKIIHLKS